MKPFVKILSIAAFAFTLTACETMEGIKQDFSNISLGDFKTASSVNNDQAQFLVDGNCPQVQIVEELSMLDEFSDGNTMKSSNLISGVRMSEAQSTCAYSDRAVTVDLKLAFDGRLGPKGRSTSKDKPYFSYPFFVAVTSANGKILAKEIFAASMTYDAGQDKQLYFETLRQIIPADTRQQGASYKVMVGFQLAENQLAYNRQILAAERAAKLAAAKQAQLSAENEAIKKAAMAPKPTIPEQPTIVKTSETTGEAVVVSPPPPSGSVTTQERAGPFDIFKTEDK